MIITQPSNKTVLDGSDPSAKSPSPEPQAPPRAAISFGVPYDSLLDEFERNSAETAAAAESIQASIFTPSYGQPF
jgi:hypothetical protein